MKSSSLTEIRYASVLTIVQNVNKFSGVGVIQTALAPRLCALVDPITIVCATHYSSGNYAIPSGSEVKFWVDPNRAITGIVDRVFVAVKDVTLIKLRAPINDVLTYGLASVEQVKFGTRFVFTGIKDVKTNPNPVFTESPGSTLMSSTSGMAKFRNTPNATMEAGDSGAPDFVYEGEKLLLIGPHAAAALTNWTTSIISYFI